MKCEEIENNLTFYIEASLSKDKMKELKTHISRCDNCNMLYKKISGCFAFVEQDKITKTNPFFYSRLKERLERKENISVFGKLKKKEPYLQIFSYAAAIAVAIVLGVVLGKDDTLNSDFTFNNSNELSEYQIFADSYNMSQPTEDTYEMELNKLEETQLDSNK